LICMPAGAALRAICRAWHHRPAPDIELDPAGEPLLPNWGRTGLLGPVDLPPDPPDEL
jgi:hypothetical protein